MVLSGNLIDTTGKANAVPSFKVGSHTGLFRTQPAKIHVPAILDDSDLKSVSIARACQQRMRGLWLGGLRLHSVSISQGSSARTCSTGTRHVHRVLQSESHIDHDRFMSMIKVAFNAYEEDIAALLKQLTAPPEDLVYYFRLQASQGRKDGGFQGHNSNFASVEWYDTGLDAKLSFLSIDPAVEGELRLPPLFIPGRPGSSRDGMPQPVEPTIEGDNGAKMSDGKRSKSKESKVETA